MRVMNDLQGSNGIASARPDFEAILSITDDSVIFSVMFQLGFRLSLYLIDLPRRPFQNLRGGLV